MTLPREQVSEGLLTELGAFEELVRSLDDDQWGQVTRCDGWTVGDVARHVVGGMADVINGRFDGLGTNEYTARQVAERAGRSPAELADECAEITKSTAGLLPMFDEAAWAAPGPGGYDGTLGDGVEALWYDAWLHADDIRSALGQERVLGSGLPGAVSHVQFELAKKGWDGAAPSGGDEAYQFILQATGRAPAVDGGPLDIYA